MSRPLITLDEFLHLAPATLGAFAAATRDAVKTDPTFVLERDEQDWFRELSAYSEYVELDERSRR